MSNTILQPGTLELYALDALPADERVNTVLNLEYNTEARQELQNIESALEQFAAAQSRNPPPAVRARVMSEIKAKVEGHTPQSAAKTASRSLSLAIFTLAAATFIAVLSAVALFYKWNDEHTNNDALRKENDKLAAMIDKETEKRQAGDELLNTLKSNDAATFGAVAANGEIKGRLYWNRTDNQAVFVSFEPTGQLIASISGSNKKSEINIAPNGNLPQFYKFSLPEGTESLRLAGVHDASDTFGEVSIILQQKKIMPKRNLSNEPPLPKTGL
ncbi:hypothetical protein MASR2M18_12360 [Ignavibacteria bacterium]|nr:hypothetical protein [Bacteroidota bacterium]MCZ2132412.1 hypothetical protein [Bacteroidota bacterium]